MANKKITRRALVMSVISLILCCAMLVGTTFAWFTDSVVSGSNVIKSGNLDIDVQYTLDGTTWSDLNGADDLFQKGLWEPGHTEVVALKITNKGSLALKYGASINVVNESKGVNQFDNEFALSDILTVTTVTHEVNDVGDILLNMVFNGAENTDKTNTKSFVEAQALAANQELLPGVSHYVIVTVDMPETVGNEANHNGTVKPEISFGLNVLATQFTHENDTFGNEYDQGSLYPVATADELAEALKNGKNVVLTDDVSMEAATTAPYGNKYAVKLDGGVLDGNGNELNVECYGDDYGIMTSGGTVKNLTIKEGCRAVMIMYPTEDIILDNVNIGGDGVLYPINTGEASSADVNLIVTNSTLAGWTSYSNIESASFTNVEFKQGTYYNNIYGRVFKPYVNTTLTNCSFVEHMNLDLSALTKGNKITMTNCTVNGQVVTANVFTVAPTEAQYDTELFTVDLPSWATSIDDCIIFR